jgi:hypothetical protein
MKIVHVLRHWHLLIVVLLLLSSLWIGGAPVFAQSGSATSSATPSDATPSVGEQIDVTINIDVSGVASPDNSLGSFTASLDWDPAVLAYVSDSGILAGFTGVVNTSSVSSGHIVFNGVKPSGATGDVTVLSITFDVVASGTSVLDLEYSTMSTPSPSFENLLPILTVNDARDTVPVILPTGGGSGGSTVTNKDYLIFDMLGEITMVEINSRDNATLEGHQAYDEDGVPFVELQQGTLVLCGDCDCYPQVIVLSLSDESLEAPEGMVIVGPIYDLTGYQDKIRQIPCSLVSYEPSASVLLHYDPALLPEGASNPVIGFYSHTENQWVILPPDTGRVAEVGVATGVTGYFASPFAVLASVPPAATNDTSPPAPEPAHFVPSGLSITPPEVKAGEAVTISLNVTNDGEESGTYTVELKINGSTVDSKIVTLDGGQGQAVSFAVSASEAGTYDASVAGLNGSFTVEKSSIWWIYLIIAAVVILLGVMALSFRRKPSK